jgi:hypothetical protein
LFTSRYVESFSRTAFTAFNFQTFNVKATPKGVIFTALALHAGRPCKWNTFVQPAVCSAEFSGEMGPKTADLAFGYATCLMADAQNGSGCAPGTSVALSQTLKTLMFFLIFLLEHLEMVSTHSTHIFIIFRKFVPRLYCWCRSQKTCTLPLQIEEIATKFPGKPASVVNSYHSNLLADRVTSAYACAHYAM